MMNVINTLCILGLGYIGLPTATAFALAGKKVIGVDVAPHLISQLNQGKLHFFEPELAEKLRQAVQNGHFYASLTPQPADAFIIAVPTPLSADNKPDLHFVFEAAESIAPLLQNGNLVILESTSPVGTSEQLDALFRQRRPDLDTFHIAYCPERVLPGKIMQEIYTNDRIIGGLTSEATEQAVALYQFFAKGSCIPTTAHVAELCKLAENSFRDVNIAFANELSMICEKLDINVWELISLANRHPRVNILQPSCGVGGHCIAVDPWFIVANLPEQAHLIRTAREVNQHKTQWVLDKVKTTLAEAAMAYDKKPSNMTIACLGISFKADVEDLRESPALVIAEQLADWHNGALWVVEPNIAALPTVLQKNACLVPLDQAIEEADIVVVLVAHQSFKALPSRTKRPRWLVDCCGIWQ